MLRAPSDPVKGQPLPHPAVSPSPRQSWMRSSQAAGSGREYCRALCIRRRLGYRGSALRDGRCRSRQWRLRGECPPPRPARATREPVPRRLSRGAFRRFAPVQSSAQRPNRATRRGWLSAALKSPMFIAGRGGGRFLLCGRSAVGPSPDRQARSWY